MTGYRPVRPDVDQGVALWTYEDVVEHVLDVFQIDRADGSRSMRMARRAVDTALRDLPRQARWAYYDRVFSFLTTASQTSSTITYDHTGGTYERMVTLASGTWPTDARYGVLKIGDAKYRVAERKSSTVITLHEYDNPGADAAAGTTYTWYRDAYPLPVGTTVIKAVQDTSNNHELRISNPADDFAAKLYYYDTPDTPWVCSQRSSGDWLGESDLILGPPPSGAVVYNVRFEAMPRPLRTERLRSGDGVTVTTSGTTATASSATFLDKHLGSVIRFGTASEYPSGRFGFRSDDNDNYFAAERVIVGITSSTVAVLDQAIDTEVSAVKFTISDPIDIETGVMATALLRACEAEYGRMTMREDRLELQENARRALLRAMEFNSRRTGTRRGVLFYDVLRDVDITTDSG